MDEIHYKPIPHNSHRYSTLGDYYYDENSDLQVRVSQLPDKRWEKLILIHELVEIILCEERDISIKDIDEFDIKFEKEREKGLHKDEDEPGHDPRAPYRNEHIFAENIERMLCHELGINFDYYSKRLIEFCNNQDKKHEQAKR